MKSVSEQFSFGDVPEGAFLEVFCKGIGNFKLAVVLNKRFEEVLLYVTYVSEDEKKFVMSSFYTGGATGGGIFPENVWNFQESDYEFVKFVEED